MKSSYKVCSGVSKDSIPFLNDYLKKIELRSDAKTIKYLPAIIDERPDILYSPKASSTSFDDIAFIYGDNDIIGHIYQVFTVKDIDSRKIIKTNAIEIFCIETIPDDLLSMYNDSRLNGALEYCMVYEKENQK